MIINLASVPVFMARGSVAGAINRQLYADLPMLPMSGPLLPKVRQLFHAVAP